MPNPADWRPILEAESDAPLHEQAWRVLGKLGLLHLDPRSRNERAAVIQRYSDIVAALDEPDRPTEHEVDKAKASQAARSKVDVDGGVPFDQRMEFLALLLTVRTNLHPTVTAFRKKYLEGRLLRWEEVGPWLAEAAARERPSLGEPRVSLWAPPFEEGERENIRIEAHDHGVIADLRRVIDSSSGAEPENWEFLGAQTAVMRVLTGAVVPLPMHFARIKRSHGTPALTTIVLEVNYRMPPRDVARIYQEYRKLAGRSGRDRGMNLKSLYLAYFTQYKAWETWMDVQRRWNERFPEWAYSMNPASSPPKLFARDCRRSYQILTGAKWREPVREPEFDSVLNGVEGDRP